MNCCQSNQCRGIEETFDLDLAESDLKNYLKKGPSRQTQRILAAFREFGLSGASLIDVGGGAGVIQHEMAAEGLGHMVNVDASPAYSQVAREEAARRGYVERAEYRLGDFTVIAHELESADFVTLDRVICCYDDMPALVRAAAAKARRALGLVYPVDRWWIRAGVRVINLVQRLLRRPFRIFVHPTSFVDELVRQSGLRPVLFEKGIFWQVVVYAR